MKLELSKAIQLGQQGQPVSSLTFRDEVVAGDLRGLPVQPDALLNDSALLLKLASRLCGRTEQELALLSLVDFYKVVEIVSNAFSASLETGS